MSKRGSEEFAVRSPALLWVAAMAFGLGLFLVSAWEWWTFRYRTFDLAFYVQQLWGLTRGESVASLLGVSLLGNHAEPVVYLLAPLYFLVPHPLVPVAVQSALLATLPWAGYRIAIRHGLGRDGALLAALALVLAPATGYAGLHEFHPETLSAPCLLWMLETRARGAARAHLAWFVLAAACKENIALVLAVYAVVQGVADRALAARERWRWYGVPGCLAAGWLALYGLWLAPRLNGGRVDYLELYSHLGGSLPELVERAIRDPWTWFAAIRTGAFGGNLVWVSALSVLGLTLLRLRWLVVAAPLYLQHLLSWRASEWTVFFHYAAPMVPLLWMGSLEVAACWRGAWLGRAIPWGLFMVGLGLQLTVGPSSRVMERVGDPRVRLADRKAKAELVQQVPARAAVTASMGFLSHLAERSDLLSAHHVLKGLRTLSRASFDPTGLAEQRVTLVDHADRATFDVAAGYYHPQMRTVTGRLVPSSDRLWHQHLLPIHGIREIRNSVGLVLPGADEADAGAPGIRREIAPGLFLEGPERLGLPDRVAGGRQVELRWNWVTGHDREVFPWLTFVLAGPGGVLAVPGGWAAPGVEGRLGAGRWRIDLPERLSPGEYVALLLFYLEERAALDSRRPPYDRVHEVAEVRLGTLRVEGDEAG